MSCLQFVLVDGRALTKPQMMQLMEGDVEAALSTHADWSLPPGFASYPTSAENITSTSSTTAKYSADPAPGTGASSAVSGVIAGILAFVLIVLMCRYRRHNQRRRHVKTIFHSAENAERVSLEHELHALVAVKARARFVLAYKQLLPTTNAGDGDLVRISEEELDRRFAALQIDPRKSNIEYFDEIGRGHSRKVLRATIGGRHVAATVAMTAPDDRWEKEEALLIEARLLSALQHRGILGVVGVKTASPQIVLFTKLMQNGDLHSFLRACRHDAKPHPRNKLTFGDVVTMAERLAAGCAYLEAHKVVLRASFCFRLFAFCVWTKNVFFIN